MAVSRVARLHLGHFTAPEGVLLARARVVVTGFLIRHPDGLVLLDTGIGEGSPEAEERYHPVRRDVREALAAAGVAPGDVNVVINCHLHFDHSGGNFLFPRVPIFAQRNEYASAHEEDYTIPGPVWDFEGASFELLDGEADVLPGIRLMPTPGHTPGHQSVVVDTDDGRVILAGQAFNFTSEFASARYSWQAARDGASDPGSFPPWVERFAELDPQRILFAHDLAVWDAASSDAV